MKETPANLARVPGHPGGDGREPNASADASQERAPFCIIVTFGVGRGVEVAVEPVPPGGRTMEFQDAELVREWAARLSEANGWPLIDRTGE